MTVDEAPVATVPVTMPEATGATAPSVGGAAWVVCAGGAAGVRRGVTGPLSRAGGRGVLIPSLLAVTSTPGSSMASCAGAAVQLNAAMQASSAGRREYRPEYRPMTRVLRLRCRAAVRAPGEQGPTRRTLEYCRSEF